MMPVIRRGCAADLPALADIQARSPQAAPWHPADYLDHDLWIATLDQTPAAFLVLRPLAPGECEVLNLAVDPDFRRRGLATALLRTALEHFHGDVFLEVRASNSTAQIFYQALGFQQLNLRPSYYSDPPESAIVMKFHSC